MSGGDAASLVYSCGSGFPFRATVFDQPATAELADSEAAAVLRGFFTTADAAGFLPLHGWWLATANGATMTFLARDQGGGGFAYVTLHRGVAGWEFDSFGSCPASVVLAKGFGNASWILDAGAPPPGAGDTEFVAMVTEEACASGRPADGRIAPPTVIYEATRILVIFAVRSAPPNEFHTCQSNPPTRVVVKLTQPIGQRHLLDGGFFPPHDTEPTRP